MVLKKLFNNLFFLCIVFLIVLYMFYLLLMAVFVLHFIVFVGFYDCLCESKRQIRFGWRTAVKQWRKFLLRQMNF